MQRSLVVLKLLLLFFALGVGLVTAQSRLSDGASLGGRIAPEMPSAQYLFDASEGDRIGLRVLGLNGLDPMVTILGPDGAEVMTGYDDAWSPEPGDSFLSFYAPAGGGYTVMVAGETGTNGDFLLQFTQSPAGSAALLPGNQTATIPVTASAGRLRLQMAVSPSCPTTLIIQPASVQVIIRLYDEAGSLIGQLDGRAMAEQRLTLAAGSGLVQIEVTPLPGSPDGELAVTLACADQQPTCREPVDEPPAPTPPAATPSGLLLVQPGGELEYGQAAQGEIGQASPQIGYTFEGAAGDEIAVQVSGISFGFDPELSLLGPTLETLVVGRNDPSSFNVTDDVVRLTLPSDGRYTALVGSAGDQPGAFLIRLLEQWAAAPQALTRQDPAVVDIAALEAISEWFLRYQFSALDDCPTALTLETRDGRPLAVGVVVRPVDGEAAGQLYASAISGASLLVPAGSGAYEVLVQRYGDLEELGQVALLLSCQADSLACRAGGVALFSTPAGGEPPFPVTTEEPGPAPTVTLVGGGATDVTAVVSVPSANVRRGDTTNHAVIRALPRDAEVAIVAVSSTGSGWFKVLTPQGEEGWMSASVLTVTGDTDSLPRLRPPAAPQSSAPAQPAGPSPQPGSNAVCGNGWCEADEAITCCTDCGTCPTAAPGATGPVCGNGTCDSGEDCSNCPGDCGRCSFCGDGFCDYGAGENEFWCRDCGYCGDGICSPWEQDLLNYCIGDCSIIIG